MAWRRPGDKPLSEPMLVRLLAHTCVTLPEWIEVQSPYAELFTEYMYTHIFNLFSIIMKKIHIILIETIYEKNKQIEYIV